MQHWKLYNVRLNLLKPSKYYTLGILYTIYKNSNGTYIYDIKLMQSDLSVLFSPNKCEIVKQMPCVKLIKT